MAVRLIHVNIGVQLCERLAAVGLFLLGVTAVRLHAYAIRARVRGVRASQREKSNVVESWRMCEAECACAGRSVCARARHAGLHSCTLALQIIRFTEEVQIVVHTTLHTHTHTHRNIRISTTHACTRTNSEKFNVRTVSIGSSKLSLKTSSHDGVYTRKVSINGVLIL